MDEKHGEKKRGNPKWVKGKSANPGTMFKPGQSGNPLGPKNRRSKSVIKEMELLTDDALERIVQEVHTILMQRIKIHLEKMFELAEGVHVQKLTFRGETYIYKEKPDVRALMYLIDRTLGKAPETLQHALVPQKVVEREVIIQYPSSEDIIEIPDEHLGH